MLSPKNQLFRVFLKQDELMLQFLQARKGRDDCCSRAVTGWVQQCQGFSLVIFFNPITRSQSYLHFAKVNDQGFSDWRGFNIILNCIKMEAQPWGHRNGLFRWTIMQTFLITHMKLITYTTYYNAVII